MRKRANIVGSSVVARRLLPAGPQRTASRLTKRLEQLGYTVIFAPAPAARPGRGAVFRGI
jgi:hypothetical protein